MKQKRRSSILETVVKPRRFSTNIGSMNSPKSPHRINLPKVPAPSTDSMPTSGSSDSVAAVAATVPAPVDEGTSPKVPPRRKKEKDSTPKVSRRKEEDTSSNGPDQKENFDAKENLDQKEKVDQKEDEQRRWSVSDLPSLQLHGQDFPTLVNMLEQVSCRLSSTVTVDCDYIIGAAGAPGHNTSPRWIRHRYAGE